MADQVQTSCWNYHNPVRVIAGPGVLDQLSELISGRDKILLITTSGSTKRGMTARIAKIMGSKGIVHDQVAPNPQLDELDKITQEFRSQDITSIIALGGGSVLDTAKVLSVTLLSNLSNPLDKIFRQKSEHTWQASLPVIAIPTTSGTGAEVTPFATVWDQTTHKKHSVEGDHVYPEIALLDPELTLTLPYQETLYTGLDAVSHALESLWNRNRTVVSQAFAIQALTLANKSLPLVLENPDDVSLRTDMQNAAMLAGLAISQTKTAIAHSISYPLTSHFGIPHGLACSFTLAKLIELNQKNNYFKTFDFKLDNTVAMLKELKLYQKISKYTNINETLPLATEMASPERLNNYIQEITKDEIKFLLKKSVQG